MPSMGGGVNVKALKMKVAFSLWVLFYAWSFYMLTYFFFTGIARGNVLYGTIWNMALILAFVVIDKIEAHLLILLKSDSTGKKFGFMRNALNNYLYGPSMKCAIYLFYIMVMVKTAVLTADPEIGLLFGSREYFLSMRYGILVLVASDKFLEQTIKDISARTNINKEVKENEQ